MDFDLSSPASNSLAGGYGPVGEPRALLPAHLPVTWQPVHLPEGADPRVTVQAHSPRWGRYRDEYRSTKLPRSLGYPN